MNVKEERDDAFDAASCATHCVEQAHSQLRTVLQADTPLMAPFTCAQSVFWLRVAAVLGLLRVPLGASGRVRPFGGRASTLKPSVGAPLCKAAVQLAAARMLAYTWSSVQQFLTRMGYERASSSSASASSSSSSSVSKQCSVSVSPLRLVSPTGATITVDEATSVVVMVRWMQQFSATFPGISALHTEVMRVVGLPLASLAATSPLGHSAFAGRECVRVVRSTTNHVSVSVLCPICNTPVDEDTDPWCFRCTRGHTIDRCCITWLPIDAGCVDRCGLCGAVSHTELHDVPASAFGWVAARLGLCVVCDGVVASTGW